MSGIFFLNFSVFELPTLIVKAATTVEKAATATTTANGAVAVG
jgi:hypothetical protein